MKVISDLKGLIVDGAIAEVRGHVTTVLWEPPEAKGWLVKVGLGPAGLVLQRGEAKVGISLDDLMKLAATADPGLVPTAEEVARVKALTTFERDPKAHREAVMARRAGLTAGVDAEAQRRKGAAAAEREFDRG